MKCISQCQRSTALEARPNLQVVAGALSQTKLAQRTSLPWATRWVFILLLLWQGLFACPVPCFAIDVDLLLRAGTIYDGTEADGQIGDVAIRGERIVAVGRFPVEKVGRIIDCKGLVVAPGFIDLHTHSDNPIIAAKTRVNLNYLIQGCTTVVTGNCGGGHVNVGEYFEKIDQDPAGTNVIHLVPHGSVRRSAMGSGTGVPTAEEMERMKSLVDQAMRDGAWGMSTGLIYVPGTYAKTDEIVELANMVASQAFQHNPNFLICREFPPGRLPNLLHHILRHD